MVGAEIFMPPYRSLPCHTGCTACGWPPGMKNKYFSRIFIAARRGSVPKRLFAVPKRADMAAAAQMTAPLV